LDREKNKKQCIDTSDMQDGLKKLIDGILCNE
jgi:hypothetical protein